MLLKPLQNSTRFKHQWDKSRLRLIFSLNMGLTCAMVVWRTRIAWKAEKTCLWNSFKNASNWNCGILLVRTISLLTCTIWKPRSKSFNKFLANLKLTNFKPNNSKNSQEQRKFSWAMFLINARTRETILETHWSELRHSRARGASGLTICVLSAKRQRRSECMASSV